MEDFSGKMIDPKFDTLNSTIRNMLKTFSLREKTAKQRILLFISAALKGRIWVCIVNGCLWQNGRKG